MAAKIVGPNRGQIYRKYGLIAKKTKLSPLKCPNNCCNAIYGLNNNKEAHKTEKNIKNLEMTIGTINDFKKFQNGTY